ncbi:MAG: bifunctional phosphoglucose/phosphomannose isomerase [Candidatus Margulisiibacteriota bacterium]
MAKPEQLDSAATLGAIDPQGMLAVVGRWPEMLQQAAEFSARVTVPSGLRASQVIVSGMGGSAIAGDIAADLLLRQMKVPLVVNRSYSLPEYAGPETLLFAMSYSGDTEETLSAVKEADRRQVQVMAVTAGGKLKELADSKKYPVFLLPAGFQPRAALPFMLVPLLTGLAKAGLAPDLSGDISEAVAVLRKVRDEYSPNRPARANLAKQLAKKLLGKLPLIFGSAGTTGAIALRAKCQFNENSKQTALANVFPELDHNELVSLAQLKRDNHNFAGIVLRDESDSERIKKRIEITKSLLSRQLGGFSELHPQGKSPLARALSLICLLDHVSVYLALLQEIDPTPVEVIGRLKKELTR